MGILRSFRLSPTRAVLLLVIVAVWMLLSADLSFGQGGMIDLYSDPGRTSCNLVDQPGPHLVYVFHEYESAVGSRWMLQNCWHTMTWLFDELSPDVSTGGAGSQGGWAVRYGGCKQPPFLMATIHYQGIGTSPTCSWIEVVADPTEPTGQVTAVDCADLLTSPIPGTLIINGDVTCPCVILNAPPKVGGSENESTPCAPLPTPTEKSTWGSIKSLYE